MRLDLDAESRSALELDAVLAVVASGAATAEGAERLVALAPEGEAAAVRAAQDELEEARSSLHARGRLLPASLPDPRPALAAVALEGYAVEPAVLRDLAVLLGTAGELRRSLTGKEAEELPRLAAIGSAIPDLRSLARDVVENVGPDGKLLDGASAELGRIRGAIGKTGDRLRRQLESFVHDPAAAHVVRDAFVTQRNGRFVVPVRADSPRPVEGIVHAASSSGATLFVEPLESVELNNELVRLAERELQEQDRIVRRWADRFRERREEVEAAVAGTVRIDVLQAKALWSEAEAGCRPEPPGAGEVELREVRHPLLDRRLKERGDRCVPLTVSVGEGKSVLVISGPNTGGKTVALKTIGLACVLHQCGLAVPAQSARLPAFRQIRADIGDHQSIDADLSTFSGHVRSVASWLGGIRPPALFLFDEIGTGTEPTEGAALAQAILERLSGSGVTAVATTHQAALKNWAFASAGAESAALEFDEATLRPTYRVLMGAAGASAGIDVAAALGLDPAILTRARELAGSRGREAEEAMSRLRALTSELEERREEMARAEEDVRERLEEADRKAVREVERIRKEAARSLEEVLAEFRKESRRELAGIEDRKLREKLEREQARSEMRLKAGIAAKGRRVAPGPKPEPLPGPFTIEPGAAVRIVSLDREGVVRSVRGERVEVEMGRATFSVRRDDLAPAAGVPVPAPTGRAARLAALLRGPEEERPDRPDVPLELHLIGKRVDEALDELEKFLDGAARQGRSEARVVHGHGTGRLKAAVRGRLQGHPLVSAFRAGEPREGGDGATVVTLR